MATIIAIWISLDGANSGGAATACSRWRQPMDHLAHRQRKAAKRRKTPRRPIQEAQEVAT